MTATTMKAMTPMRGAILGTAKGCAMNNFLFEITDGLFEGERFFVQAEDKAEAVEILDEYFPDESLQLLGVYTDEEAEWMGYDTY